MAICLFAIGLSSQIRRDNSRRGVVLKKLRFVAVREPLGDGCLDTRTRPELTRLQLPNLVAFPPGRRYVRAVSTSGQSTPALTPLHGEALPRPAFVTTHWSVVLSAGHSDTTRARAALESLCQNYWYPLYAYVRRRGYSPADAQDLTQEFFARLLEHHWIRRADQQKGRFRSFLLSAMNHFLADEWDKARAQKRGGGVIPLPLQFDTAENRYRHEPSDNVTPEQNYERCWALTVLDKVLHRLRAEYEQEDRADFFAALHPFLVGEGTDQPYAQLAVKLRMTEGAVKTAVYRLRQRYRQLLRDEIAQTVAEPGEVDEELHHLVAVLSG
jgi:RNA polymerase sigma factor (sigma-70 family)